MESKIISFNAKKNSNLVNGTSALKMNIDNDKQEYSKPKLKKLSYKKIKQPIVMGCWQESYSANGGDGC